MEHVNVPIIHHQSDVDDGKEPAVGNALHIPITLSVCMDASRREAMLLEHCELPPLRHNWNNRSNLDDSEVLLYFHIGNTI